MVRLLKFYVIFFGITLFLCASAFGSDPPFDGGTNSGTIDLRDGDWFTIDSDFENTEKGTINISGSSGDSGRIFFDYGLFSNSGKINILDYGAFQSNADFVNSGELNISGYSAGFEVASGTLNSSGKIYIGDSATFTVNAGAIFVNTGLISNYGTLRLFNSVTNAGILENFNMVNVASNFQNNGTVDNFKDLSIIKGSFTNSNILNNKLGGNVYIQIGTTLDNKNRLVNSGIIEAGTEPNPVPGSVGQLINSGIITNEGTVKILNTGSFINNGTVNNSGTFIMNGTNYNCTNGVFNNKGLVQVYGSVSFGFDKSGSINLLAEGTLENYGTLVQKEKTEQTNYGILRNKQKGLYENYGTLINYGKLINERDAVIMNKGYIINESGSKTVNDGLIDSAQGIYRNYGETQGSGTFISSFINEAGGVLKPGNSVGTITVENFTNKSGGTVEIEVNNSGSDLIVVKNKAIIQGGTVKVIPDSNIVIGDERRFTFLTAGGGVFGSFAGIENSPFFSFRLDQDANNMYLVLRRVRICDSSNECAIEPVIPDDAMNVIYGLTEEEARAAYNQIAGLSHTAVPAVTFAYFNQYMDIVAARMNGFAAGGPQSSMLGIRPVMFTSRTDTGNDAENRLLMMASNASAIPGGSGNAPEWGFWMQAYGSLGQRRADDVSSKYDYNTAGVVAGFDKQVSDSVLVGAALGYSYTKLDMKDLSEDSKMWSYQGSLYGMYKEEPLYLSAIAAYGFNKYDTKRDMAFGSLSRSASSDYNGHIFSIYLEGGRVFKTSYADIIPMAAFRAGYFSRDAFTETGADSLNIDADKMSVSSYIGSVGVRLKKQYECSYGIIVPEIRIRWDHEFSNDNYTLDGAFVGSPGGTYTVIGDRPDRDRLVGGAGISWRMDENMSFHLLYEGSFAGDDTRHAGMLGYIYRW